jgi:hypothetical protein
MQKSCFTCLHLQLVSTDPENPGKRKFRCASRPANSTLQNFPFHSTECKRFEISLEAKLCWEDPKRDET